MPPWPKVERRGGNRRKGERRDGDRRNKPLEELQRTEIKYPAALLTQEERELIEFLSRSEDEPDTWP